MPWRRMASSSASRRRKKPSASGCNGTPNIIYPRPTRRSSPPSSPPANEIMSETEETESPKKGERIAKRLSRAGICSRRDAELLIEGVPVPAKEPVRLWRYHKPRNLVTSHRDPQGRPTVFDALPEAMPRVISIGRLDFTSEGLLLLTNDGDLARRLELPSTGWL